MTRRAGMLHGPLTAAVGQAALLEAIAERAADFDVIHFHIDWLHLPMLSRLNVPFVTTCHGRLDLPGFPEVIRRFPNAPFISISDHQQLPLPGARWLGTIYHGMPKASLNPSYSPGTYLAFLGRLTAEKGPERAIRIATAVNMPLHIAAKIPRGERGYFKEKLEPLIDGKRISLEGEVDDRGKQPFLANAAALLFPIDWPEPFGLIMIEAMACGTPVIAFRCGSVPEVIEDGVTGFVVDDEAGAVEAISRLGELDRRRVRARFEERFTSRRMAEEYVRQYAELTSTWRPEAEPQPCNGVPIAQHTQAQTDKALSAQAAHRLIASDILSAAQASSDGSSAVNTDQVAGSALLGTQPDRERS